MFNQPNQYEINSRNRSRDRKRLRKTINQSDSVNTLSNHKRRGGINNHNHGFNNNNELPIDDKSYTNATCIIQESTEQYDELHVKLLLHQETYMKERQQLLNEYYHRIDKLSEPLDDHVRFPEKHIRTVAINHINDLTNRISSLKRQQK